MVNTLGDTSRPDATNIAEGITTEKAEHFLRAAIGVPEIPVEVLDIAPWQAVADNATSFQQGRVLLAGDAAHTMPPNGGFGGNTGVQDAFNLSWKIAQVLAGQAGPELVDTYDHERQPIGRLTIEQAYTRYVLRTAPYLGTDHIQPIADDLSLEIGHRYRSAAVLPDPAGADNDDGLPYVDPRESRGLPGTRAPHLWIDHEGERVSTLDLFRKHSCSSPGRVAPRGGRPPAPPGTSWACRSTCTRWMRKASPRRTASRRRGPCWSGPTATWRGGAPTTRVRHRKR